MSHTEKILHATQQAYNITQLQHIWQISKKASLPSNPVTGNIQAALRVLY